MEPKRVPSTPTTNIVLPGMTNTHNTIFGGELMSMIDISAAITAQRHAGHPVVTAAMDSLSFKKPIKLGDIVIVQPDVNHVGRSSMEIGVRVEREDPLTGEREHAATAYLTFVAIDENGKPVEVPPLALENPDHRRRNKEALIRREQRLQLRTKQQQAKGTSVELQTTLGELLDKQAQKQGLTREQLVHNVLQSYTDKSD